VSKKKKPEGVYFSLPVQRKEGFSESKKNDEELTSDVALIPQKVELDLQRGEVLGVVVKKKSRAQI